MTEAVDRSRSERDPLIGTKLGGYEIVGTLGRGGSAVVYRANQAKLDREVALKVLIEGEDEGGVTPEQVEAFMREARAAAAFSHPCLVQVHDVGEADGRHFLSMELVPGGNLAQCIKAEGAIPWREAVPIIRDIAEALQCAHEHGMVHKDVKPANVLLTRTGRAKLADLGLAMEKKHAGTAAFMAPEQVLRRKVGKRSDIYSLGCTAFAILTGKVPFQYTTSKHMLTAHVKEQAPSIRSQDVKVPQDLERLLAKMLAKQPGDRPHSAADVIDALDRLESDGRLQPSKGLRKRRARRQRSRSDSTKANAVWLIVLVALAAAAVALALNYFR